MDRLHPDSASRQDDLLCSDQLAARGFIWLNATPDRISAPATAMLGVSASSSRSHAHTTPNNGIMYVTVAARGAPMRWMRRKYRTYASPVHNTPSSTALTHDVIGMAWRGHVATANGATSTLALINVADATALAGRPARYRLSRLPPIP